MPYENIRYKPNRTHLQAVCHLSLINQERFFEQCKEITMLPPTFSSHETYGKHRSPDDISRMERQTRELQAREYRYGTPINSKQNREMESPRAQNEPAYARPNNPFFVLRLVRFLLGMFG